MQLEEFLSVKSTSLQEVTDTALQKVSLEADDMILIVGSLSEGLATIKSDMDLILVTERAPSEFPDGGNISWVNGKCLVDLQVINRTEADQLIHRLNVWAEQNWKIGNPVGFDPEERKLLQRFFHGIPLGQKHGKSGFVNYTEKELCRLKLYHARQMAWTIQVDMVGHLARQDYRSLAYAAQELLGHTVDALIAGFSYTNPLLKWRSYFLDQLPDCGIESLDVRYAGTSASDLIWQAYLLPGEPTADAILEYTYSISHLCRTIFWWAELRLIRPDRTTAVHRIEDPGVSEAPPTEALPRLEIDLDFIITDSGYKIARLNEFGSALDLSPEEFSLLMQFDGVTSAEQAIRAINGDQPAPGVEKQLAHLVEQCKAFDFLANPNRTEG